MECAKAGVKRTLCLAPYTVPRTEVRLRTPADLSMDLTSVVDILERIAPPSTAASWDNVGLLVEPSGAHAVRDVLFTNDLTERVMDEAVKQGVQLIVSYHPPIFAPLRALRQSRWKERVVVRCLENRIAVYSPHTAWDVAQDGTNDWLASCFGPATTEEGGVVRTLTSPVALGELAALLKAHLGAPVRLALADRHTLHSPVARIALCAGSGASLLRDADAELLVTGEMSHHELLDATHRGSSVLLCEHAVSERGSLAGLAERVRQEAPTIGVHLARADIGPLQPV